MSGKSEPSQKPEPPKSEFINAEKDFTPNKFEDFGYFFYPERFNKTHQTKWFEKILTISASREELRKLQCEENLKSCMEKRNRNDSLYQFECILTAFIQLLFFCLTLDPGVKLLVSALKSTGW